MIALFSVDAIRLVVPGGIRGVGGGRGHGGLVFRRAVYGPERVSMVEK